MRTVLKGNSAVAHAVRMARAQVISAYPITPQTTIVEELADMVAKGELDARFIKVESEHSAMAGCIAAASAGARTFTATSSQGLVLMHEMLHWATGARLPIVMANVNRALGAPWNIWVDQTDSLSQRDTGWMQLYCQSAQEVFDSVIQAFEVSQRVLLPTMVLLDAFYLSHTYEDMEMPEQRLVDDFLSVLETPHKIDLARPASLGPIADASVYMEFRNKIELAHQQALVDWEEVGRTWGNLTGRNYGLVEEYRNDDAQVVLVACGTPAMTARAAVDSLRESGVPAGLLRLRVFRPFPADTVRYALAGKKAVVVLDRNCSFGHHGIFHQEIKSALYDLSPADRPLVRGIVAGLGGRDITPRILEQMLLLAWNRKLSQPCTWWNTSLEQEPAEACPAVEIEVRK
jgi:pyruvate/2-oxoacid:ferredoxin oxidoreductase alpha subunit